MADDPDSKADSSSPEVPCSIVHRHNKRSAAYIRFQSGTLFFRASDSGWISQIDTAREEWNLLWNPKQPLSLHLFHEGRKESRSFNFSSGHHGFYFYHRLRALAPTCTDIKQHFRITPHGHPLRHGCKIYEGVNRISKLRVRCIRKTLSDSDTLREMLKKRLPKELTDIGLSPKLEGAFLSDDRVCFVSPTSRGVFLHDRFKKYGRLFEPEIQRLICDFIKKLDYIGCTFGLWVQNIDCPALFLAQSNIGTLNILELDLFQSCRPKAQFFRGLGLVIARMFLGNEENSPSEYYENESENFDRITNQMKIKIKDRITHEGLDFLALFDESSLPDLSLKSLIKHSWLRSVESSWESPITDGLLKPLADKRLARASICISKANSLMTGFMFGSEIQPQEVVPRSSTAPDHRLRGHEASSLSSKISEEEKSNFEEPDTGSVNPLKESIVERDCKQTDFQQALTKLRSLEGEIDEKESTSCTKGPISLPSSLPSLSPGELFGMHPMSDTPRVRFESKVNPKTIKNTQNQIFIY
eukprot:CAMPEP_0114997946 /NCGR_PEP_ID=MMETSP0216-20121206/15204_1 /TAXON_ID=223996 /ORGANISM="Protocruzia adherens, Strain Boccale" /LENGTH=527 /DNA_ID=CAMNT_0002362429 /DNA_START=38 /DNA_END=1621 /DNA_ORIENTATION=-